VSEYFDDIKIRKVIVTVAEMVTVIEMVVRVNPFIDPDQNEDPTPPERWSGDQDLTKLLANSRR
jgi:hypothetical protein